MISARERAQFRKKIACFYRKQRRSFPWRETRNPYRILISEIMLQQTQTDRVIEYYKKFLKKFPAITTLAEAPLSQVLEQWQGLGYNRRARYLREMAVMVLKDFKGKIPSDPSQLMTLPGIGQYTANAICVFAFNQSLPLIETNVRSVYIDSFFPGRSDVHDRELLPLIQETIDEQDPREWFYALMDYGSYLKKQNRAVNGRSAHYVRQSKFVGSRRQLRGIVIKRLLDKRSLRVEDLLDLSTFSEAVRSEVLAQLETEGLIKSRAGLYRLV